MSLRLLSYALRRVHLSGVFDATLFWPFGHEQSAPHWPNLEVLNVSFYAAAPDGTLYFRGLEHEAPAQGFDINAQHYQPLDETPELEHQRE